ncbi:MAG: hypothetical protein HY282_15770 [Nitrospirae bacterium]|nr:hypothetical protein [Candidatus Manganitrophaceae bacterium]
MILKEELSEAIEELNRASAAVEKQTQAADPEEMKQAEWRITYLQAMVRYLLANCRVENLLRESLADRVKALENEMKIFRNGAGPHPPPSDPPS